MNTISHERIRALVKASRAVTHPSSQEPRINVLTDPSEDVPVGVHGILAASEKVLAINRGLVPTDERDSLQFKRVMTTDNLLRERVKRDADKVRMNVMRRVAKTRNLKALHAGVFDSYTEGHILGNPLSMPLEEINPMQLVEQARRVTLMGPGGIGSDEAITPSMQGVHPSTFGFMCTISGPESSRAGVDTRLAHGVKIGSDGQLYQRFRRPGTGKHVWLSAEDLDGKTVKVPD